MGDRGPAPKRSDQRRRANAPSAGDPVKVPAGKPAEPPEGDAGWHPVIAAWFESLKVSGQAVFYEASDWAFAFVLAESLSRELKPQPIVAGKGADAVVEMHELPPKAATLAAFISGNAALNATEGARRRGGLELQQPKPTDGGGNVTRINDVRRRLGGTG